MSSVLTLVSISLVTWAAFATDWRLGVVWIAANLTYVTLQMDAKAKAPKPGATYPTPAWMPPRTEPLDRVQVDRLGRAPIDRSVS